MNIVTGCGAGLALLLAIGCIGFGLPSLLVKGSRVASVLEWRDRGATPLGDKKFTPQGMCWVDGKLLFANTWKNERSRVYEIDPETMEIQRHFDMPGGAVHTSGLAWDGVHLWGVDNASNKAYCMKLESSLAAGEVDLAGSFDTTLKGTSACCFLTWEGKRLLAISDFMHSRKTVFVDAAAALAQGTAADAIVFAYRNEGFSQGLEFVGGKLLESENKLGVDVINEMDLELLKEKGHARKATLRQFNGPDRGIEDLAWDGERLWVSDEAVFRFFSTTFHSSSPVKGD